MLVIAITLISTSQAFEELNYTLQLGLADDQFKAIHMQLAMIQSTLCAYNESSLLISSVKRTIVEVRMQWRLRKSEL